MSTPSIPNPNPSLAIIGGTGKEGSAIAMRFAKAGVRTIIGSRDAAKAQNMANAINSKFNTKNVEGYTNRDATAKADIVLINISSRRFKLKAKNGLFKTRALIHRLSGPWSAYKQLIKPPVE